MTKSNRLIRKANHGSDISPMPTLQPANRLSVVAQNYNLKLIIFPKGCRRSRKRLVSEIVTINSREQRPSGGKVHGPKNACKPMLFRVAPGCTRFAWRAAWHKTWLLRPGRPGLPTSDKMCRAPAKSPKPPWPTAHPSYPRLAAGCDSNPGPLPARCARSPVEPGKPR